MWEQLIVRSVIEGSVESDRGLHVCCSCHPCSSVVTPYDAAILAYTTSNAEMPQRRDVAPTEVALWPSAVAPGDEGHMGVFGPETETWQTVRMYRSTTSRRELQ